MTAEIAVGALIPGRRPQRPPAAPAPLLYLAQLDAPRYLRRAHHKETAR